MRASIARGHFKETARGTIADAFASPENKQKSSGFSAGERRPDFRRLSRQQAGAAAIENPPFAGAGEGFVKKKAGLVELSRKFLRRTLKIVPPRARGARISRVGKMGYIGYAGPLLLDCDFALEFLRHPGKLGYHRFDLRDATARFVDLEAPETCKGIPRFHNFNSKTQVGPATRSCRKGQILSTRTCSNSLI
jgi:hypothetical protein